MGASEGAVLTPPDNTPLHSNHAITCKHPFPLCTCLTISCCHVLHVRLINRELVAWCPDDNADSSMFALEDSGEGGWDQFAVNRRKFGYESGWNEDFYTVKLDKAK